MKRLSISNPWAEAPVLYRDKTVSTMEDALMLAREGYPAGTVIAAGYQEQGRGRFPGRTWSSAPGENLLFTLLMRMTLDFPFQRLPLLAGLALSLALEDLFQLDTEIKWPNDLLFRERKLAGILCQSHVEVVLIGIGLNCNQNDFEPGLDASACSLKQILGREVQIPTVLEGILFRIKEELEDGRWLERLEARLFLRGREILVTGPRMVRGVLVGLAPNGALLVQTHPGGEPLSLVSGEIRKI